MITKKQFTEYISLIKEHEDRIAILNKALQTFSPDFGGFHDEYGIVLMVRMISDLVEDEEDYIGYHLWEGGGEVTFPGGKKFTCKTSGSTYDCIKYSNSLND